MTMQIEPLATREADATAGQVACAHCNLPVPTGMIDEAAEHQFCCAGCRAVFQAVRACGLDTYYKLRDSAAASLVPANPGRSSYDAFDSESFARLYVTDHQDGMRSVDLFLEGVTCAACVWLVERLPTVLGGVVEARLSLRRATVRVTWDPTAVSLSRVARSLDSFGYTPHPAKGVARETLYRKELRRRLVHLGVAGAISGNLMLLAAALYAGWTGAMDGSVSQMLRWISLGLGLISLCWPGAEFFKSAWGSIRARAINLDVPICMALLAGGVAGTINVIFGRGEVYFDSLSALVLLLLVGRFLQFRHQRRSEDAVELLFSMTPSTCRVVSGADGSVRETPIAGLTEGEVVEVLAGDLVPADGIVERGASTVDQALLTGESAPHAVEVGSEVFGSSQNGPSTLRIRITRVGEQSRVGQLMKLLERGLSEKPEIVRFGDKVGRWFTLCVSLAALATFVYWSRINMTAAIDNTVAMLIVTCPCVLGLATPMTIAVAIGQLARRDILVKSGASLEKLARGGRLLLDKTGTLTTGKMRVVQCVGDQDVRGVVARVESLSRHPVARALREAFESCEPPSELRGLIENFAERNDGGVSAVVGGRSVRIGSAAFMLKHGVSLVGFDALAKIDTTAHTIVFVSVDGQTRAAIAIDDTPRADSPAAVEALRSLGFAPEIWSGDGQRVVDRVARSVHIPSNLAHGGKTPEDKLDAVKAPAHRGGACVMVGDGVNDAAALAAAGVGIAVHGGSEASLAAADVYIARPGLMPVVDLVETSRKTIRIIRRNLCVSLAYNLLAGYLAATGRMNPLVAAILMPLSSATVMSVAVASMRDRRRRRGRGEPR